MEGSAPYSTLYYTTAPPSHSIAPRAQHYLEIFHSFRSGRACSIPVLHLPPFDDSSAAFDFSDFFYSDIFRGSDFALSYHHLFRPSAQSSQSHDRTQVGTENLSEEFDTSCHKLNIPGNVDLSEGSSLLMEVDGCVCITCDGCVEKCGIKPNRNFLSISDACLKTEPPTAVDWKKDLVSSMSDYERPKSKAAKSLFDVSSLGFLNVEFDTGSSDVASPEAIKEAMDTTKMKLKNVRESMERKKDSAKDTRPVPKNDMDGIERVRMAFDVSISRDDKLQSKHESEHSLFKISGKGMQDVSEALQAANVAATALERKITKNRSSSEIAEREDNWSRLKDANQLETKEEVCVQKRTEGRKRAVSPRDEKQQSNMWLKKADKEIRKRDNEVFEKEESEIKPEEVQKMERGQDNVEEATMSNCSEKKLTHSIGKEKFEKLEVGTSYNRTEKKVDAAHDLAEKSLKLERFANTDKITDEVADEEIVIPVHTSKSENYQNLYRESSINVEQKMYRGDLHDKLKSIDQHSYNQRNVTVKNYKLPEMTCKLEEIEREHLRELELEKEKERVRELQKERIRKVEKERERECERQKDRMASAAQERVSAEANEMAERDAVERETAEARQRAMAEARERLEKACAEAREKSLSEKASTEAWLRAERFAVARAAAEARERAIEKAMTERVSFEARDQVARSASEKFSSPLRDLELRHTSSSCDLWNSNKNDEAEAESAQRCKARLERHRRTVERVAKALTEKSTRDLIAQEEQAERNRLAKPLDTDFKRWSNGKEGNLRALLSTLQYILGPDSGWHPIPLTEIMASASVKKAYRKATLFVHPDKLQQRGATIEQKYICEKVFDLLKDSWNKFNSEER